jgi:glycosyltransferase involved in cell wall biosynthesis
MTKPRILLLTHYYESHRGGVELVAWKVACGLAAKGYQIEWAASNTDPLPPEVPGIRFMPMQAFNLVEQKLGIPYPIWSKSSKKLIQNRLREVDLLHIHDSLYQGNVYGARQAAKMGKPYIVTQHIGYVPYKNPVLRTVLTVANKNVALPTLQGAHGIGFVSESTQNYFKNLGLTSDKGELIPNGVDTKLFNPEVPSDPAAFGLDPDRPICLFVGRFVEKKGLPMIKALAESMAGVQWALAGWGPISPEKWGLPNVTVLSNLSGPTLAPLYRSADLLIMPSVGEGFPLVVQEAMACGTAAIVTSETAEGYLAAGAVMRSAPANDLEAWRKMIEMLLKDRQKLRDESANILRFVRDHWSWEKCADQYDRMICNILGTTP